LEPTDLTVEILKDIRTELRQVRTDLSARIDVTNSRIDETNLRLNAMREELSNRIVESEVRTATAIADLAGTVREMTQVLRQAHDLRPRVERCESDIAELKRQITAR
jgi:hypothetical protein